MNEADSYVDLKNNEIGRKIGEHNPNSSQNILADGVIDYYYEHGLWEVQRTEGGKYLLVQKKLSQEQYDELKQAVATMNRYGYLKNVFEDKLKKLGVSESEIAMFKKIPIETNF